MGNQFNLAEIYRYENVEADLKKLEKQFADLVELETIALSVQGRKLYNLKVGKGQLKMLCHGAHHAREWMTSRLIVDFNHQVRRFFGVINCQINMSIDFDH